MRYLFKGYPRQFARIFLGHIVIALLLTAIYWFFNSVVFGNVTEFLSFWKLAYLILMSVDLFLLLLNLLIRLFGGLHYRAKFQASYSDVMEAWIEHKLFKADGEYRDWTPEQFQRKLGTARMAHVLAEAMVKSLFDS